MKLKNLKAGWHWSGYYYILYFGKVILGFVEKGDESLPEPWEASNYHEPPKRKWFKTSKEAKVWVENEVLGIDHE